MEFEGWGKMGGLLYTAEMASQKFIVVEGAMGVRTSVWVFLIHG